MPTRTIEGSCCCKNCEYSSYNLDFYDDHQGVQEVVRYASLTLKDSRGNTIGYRANLEGVSYQGVFQGEGFPCGIRPISGGEAIGTIDYDPQKRTFTVTIGDQTCVGTAESGEWPLIKGYIYGEF